MSSALGRLLVEAVAAAGSVPAAAVDPSAVVDAPAPVRAGGVFVLVLALGGVLLAGRRGFVDRSVDALVDRPRIAVFYGVAAYLIVLVVGLYPLSQVGQLPAGGAVAGRIVAVLLVLALGLLTGAGFLAVGTVLTEVWGPRRPRHGLVVGAALSALAPLALPGLLGLGAAVVVAAFGIGGAARVWFHSEYAVDR